MKKAKYPIKDEELLVLMKKYPFLRYHNYKGQQMFHGKSKNLEVNYYNYWDGNGWEDLWKNRYGNTYGNRRIILHYNRYIFLYDDWC